MRISRVKIRAFRGFQGEQSFDFDTECVILAGPNGRGKTSVFDAVLWALLGEIPRLKGSRDAVGDKFIVRNALAKTSARVELDLVSSRGELLTITRDESALEVAEGSTTLRGAKASEYLIKWLSSGRELDAAGLGNYLVRTHLLQQDTMMEFVRSDTPRERFRLLSSFLGLGRLSEQYGILDQSVKDAQRSLQTRENRLASARRDEDHLKAQFADEKKYLGETAGVSFEELRGRFMIVVPSLEPDGTLPRDLEELEIRSNRHLAKLEQRIKVVQLRVDDLKQLMGSLPSVAEEIKRIEVLSNRRAETEKRYEEAVTARKASLEATDASRKIVEQLAEILSSESGSHERYLSFLNNGRPFAKTDECPFCGQPIKRHVLEKRLNELIALTPESIRELTERYGVAQSTYDHHRKALNDYERRERLAKQELDQLVQSLDLSSTAKRVRKQLTAFEINIEEPLDRQDMMLRDVLADNLGELSRLQSDQERLLNIIGETRMLRAAARLSDLEGKLESANAEVVRLSDEVSAAKQLVDNLQHAVSAAKGAESELVEELMRGYEPILKEYFYRVQPHPQFSDLRVQFKTFGNAGEVYFRAVNPAGAEINPSVTFSAGQASALAVSLFLALNAQQNWTTLQTVMIDDPIQYLDDISMLGLVDLLRSWAEKKQVILSIHDRSLVPLLLGKFRGVREGTRVRVYFFEGMSMAGPVVSAPFDEVLDDVELSIVRSTSP